MLVVFMEGCRDNRQQENMTLDQICSKRKEELQWGHQTKDGRWHWQTHGDVLLEVAGRGSRDGGGLCGCGGGGGGGDQSAGLAGLGGLRADGLL